MTDPTQPPTPEEIVRRLLRAALRRSASPFEQRLALKEYERIETERREAFIEELAAHFGQEVSS